MIDHLDLKIQIFILGAPFILIFIGFILDVHLASIRNYMQITSALARSDCLQFAIRMWGERSMKSRIFVISMLSSEIMFPRSNIRRGSLDAEDLQQLPKNLKKTMIASSYLTIAGFVWLVMSYFIT